jgi:hypothetical protein
MHVLVATNDHAFGFEVDFWNYCREDGESR